MIQIINSQNYIILHSKSVQVIRYDDTDHIHTSQKWIGKLLDQVAHDREIIIIQQRGEEEVAMIAASELQSLMETAHLLRSPANAERLITALGSALNDKVKPISLDELRGETGFDEENP